RRAVHRPADARNRADRAADRGQRRQERRREAHRAAGRLILSQRNRVMAKKKKVYGYKENPALRPMEPPALKYQPPRPRRYNPPIGLIGCGGISGAHLAAYKKMGLNVVALCDLIPERA